MIIFIVIIFVLPFTGFDGATLPNYRRTVTVNTSHHKFYV